MDKNNPVECVGKLVGRYEVLAVIRKHRNYFTVKCATCSHVKDVRCDAFLKKQKDHCHSCDRMNPYYKSNTYNSWDAMLQRCLNRNSTAYYKYGDIGITVQNSWVRPGGEGFKNFFSYMGECPDGLTLDRWPDNTGNYEEGNVRWATNSEQGYNQKQRATNTSGRTGVSWAEAKQRWVARITHHNKDIYLGSSVDFELACCIREEAELKYYGFVKE